MKILYHPKLLIWLFVAITTTNFGCGRQQSAPAVKKQTADGLALTIPCNQENKCPPVPMAIIAAPLENNQLVGTISAKEPWTFTGIPQGDNSRDYRMHAFNPPVGGNFIGQGTLKISVEYNAFEEMQGQAPIDVIMRDVERCKFMRPTQAAFCEDLTQKGFEEFELKSSVPWIIRNGEIVQDPSFTADPGSQLGANSGMVGCTQAFLPGLLSGLMGGNLMKGVMNGAIGCVSNSMQNVAK